MDWKVMIEEMMSLGLTQAEIARACGCSQTLISFLRTGRRKNVIFKTGALIISTYENLQNKKR